MDPDGNLYGTLFSSNNEVFRITPSGGQWTQTGYSGFDGGLPEGNVVLDTNGNLYSTASGGGAHNDGVIFEITPQ